MNRAAAVEMLTLLARSLADAERKVARTSAARAALPAGSSRARVTTANARWATACEHRDRVQAALLAHLRGELPDLAGRP